MPSRRRTSSGSPSNATRGSSSIPSRITENFDSGATPRPTSSSRTSGLTATSRSETRASAVSIARKTSVPSVPKYPRSTWPWNVCTTTGRRPASSAAARPTAPALAVCVWTTSGRTARMMRASRQAAIASRTGESSRDRPGSCTTETPARCATNAIDSSPRATSPATSVVSYPRSASPRVRYVTWSAGPPTLRRAITRSTRIGPRLIARES